jgi:hypothetical protein
MVLGFRETSMEAISAFLSKNPKTTQVATFKGLQALLDWRRMGPVLAYMKSENARPAGLTGVINKAADDMWFGWHLMHPGLKGSHVHPDRRVPTASIVLAPAKKKKRQRDFTEFI